MLKFVRELRVALEQQFLTKKEAPPKTVRRKKEKKGQVKKNDYLGHLTGKKTSGQIEYQLPKKYQKYTWKLPKVHFSITKMGGGYFLACTPKLTPENCCYKPCF